MGLAEPPLVLHRRLVNVNVNVNKNVEEIIKVQPYLIKSCLLCAVIGHEIYICFDLI